jgi:hypothetical protein
MRSKFRPSSHSTDYTIIGTCKNAEAAEKLVNAVKDVIANAKCNDDVDWELPETLIMQNRVLFTAHTDGEASLDVVKDAMANLSERVETYPKNSK